MSVRSYEHLPPSRCLKGARALIGDSRASTAQQLGIPQSLLAAAEKNDDETSAIQVVMSAYREIGVAVNVAPQAWIVTRRRGEGETEDGVYGLATAAARNASGFTQQMLATSAGVSLRTVIALEQGGGALRATQDAIASALLRRNVEVINPGDRWGFRLNLDESAEELDNSDNNPPAAASQYIEAPLFDPDIPNLIRLRVEIERTKPIVWREILIPENATFEDLHRTIQVAFGWRDEHLHEFDAGLRIGPASLNEDGPVSDGKVVDERLAWLYDLSSGARSFVYLYDFGDSWRHTVSRIGVEARMPGAAYPAVVSGGCAGPVENSGSSEGWNAMARSLRRRSANEDLLNGLQRLGYGRDYDPDRFDIQAVNEHLANLDFPIEKTWMDQSKLRDQIHVDAPFLRPPASIEPRRRRAARKSADGFTVLAVEPFGEARYEVEGLGAEPNQGVLETASKKMDGRVVQTRGLAGQLLIYLLEYAADVVSYGGFPVRIVYNDGSDEAVLIPDYEVFLTDGRRILVQVVTEHNFHLLQDYLLLRSKLAGLGHILAVLPSGLFEASEIKVAYELRRFAPAPWEKPDTSAAEFLADLTRKHGVIPMKDAIRILLEHGFADTGGRTGGTSENRVLYRILSCVASGAISIDATVSEVRISSIGTPETFAGTMSFGRLVEEADIRSAPTSGVKARARRRPASRA